MVFSSVTFLCLFFPLVVVLHSLLKSIRARNALLLIASLLFYAWDEPVWILAMLFTVLVNYISARLLERTAEPRKRKLYLVIGLVISFGFLFYFKYALFTLNSVRALLGLAAVADGPTLPIGISFYTFQVVTYTVDVYRGKSAVQKNFAYLLLYVSFFPQLIAGPIVQYGQIERALTERTVTQKGLFGGFLRFVWGLGKKVLLANLFAEALAALPVFAGAGTVSLAGAWLAALLFALQIFFDFAGYSDMAIGMGRMFGFRFLENFDAPYISSSISEFWRRWHISLGSFFREYVYIPLGGNRVGRGRLVFNLLLVWTLTGLWHGASWNFVAWGLYYGILIVLERLLPEKLLSAIPKALRHVLTLLLVLVGWMLFYYESLPLGLGHIGSLFGSGVTGWIDGKTVYAFKRYAVFLAAGVAACLPWRSWYGQWNARWTKGRRRAANVLRAAAAAVLFALSVCFLIGQTYNPFLYFRF